MIKDIVIGGINITFELDISMWGFGVAYCYGLCFMFLCFSLEITKAKL